MLMLDVPTPLDYMLKEEEGEKKKETSQSQPRTCFCNCYLKARVVSCGASILTSCVLLIMVRMHSLDAVTYSTRSITHLRIDAPSNSFSLVWAMAMHMKLVVMYTHTTYICACFMHDKRSTNVLTCVLKVLVCFVLYYVASPPKCFFIVASTFPPSPLLARCWQVPSCRLNSQRGLCDIYSVLCLFITGLPIPIVYY